MASFSIRLLTTFCRKSDIPTSWRPTAISFRREYVQYVMQIKITDKTLPILIAAFLDQNSQILREKKNLYEISAC